MEKDNNKIYEIITALSCILTFISIGYLFHACSPLIKESYHAFGLILWVLLILGAWTNVVKLIAIIQTDEEKESL